MRRHSLARAGGRVFELSHALLGLDRRRSLRHAPQVGAIEMQRLLVVAELSLTLAHVVKQRRILLDQVRLLILEVGLLKAIEVVERQPLARVPACTRGGSAGCWRWGGRRRRTRRPCCERAAR